MVLFKQKKRETKARPEKWLWHKGSTRAETLWIILSDTLSHSVAQEVRRAEPLVWMAVSLLAGTILYFQAPAEPDVAIMIALLLLSGFVTYRLRHKGHSFYGAAFLSCLLAGFVSGCIHTCLLSVQTLKRSLNVTLEATVIRSEWRPSGTQRMIFTDIEILKGRAAEPLPKKIRLNSRARNFDVKPGDRLSFHARLTPPPGPVIPGGYDFGRDLYFKGIGATGFIYGTPEIIARSVRGGWFSTEKWRSNIARRIRIAFATNGQTKNTEIAAALLVGERGGIAPDTREILAVSGLAHILAISGLHMALVMTFVIFAVRGLLAVSASLTISYPIKTIAISVGLLTGSVYFVLSGGSVSATRAFVMVSIMVVALMLGRKALSVRNIAIAVILVLLVNPAAVLNPGFQMSFIATLALVAFAGSWTFRFNEDEGRMSFTRRLVRIAGCYLLGLIVTSLIAGVTTGLFAAFHFHRIAPMGLFTNLLGLPVFSLLVMPFGFLGMIAMPFGFEAVPFAIMGEGISLIVRLATIMANLSENAANTGALDRTGFAILTIVLLGVCLLKTKVRLVAIPFAVLGFFFLVHPQRPTIFIAEDGKTVAVVTAEKALQVSGARSGRFDLKIWRAVLGFTADRNGKAYERAVCDHYGCVLHYGTTVIAHVKHPSGFYQDCKRADIVISGLSAPDFCYKSTMVIDRQNLKSQGAHSLVLLNDQNGGVVFQKFTAIPALKRPWHDGYSQQE